MSPRSKADCSKLEGIGRRGRSHLHKCLQGCDSCPIWISTVEVKATPAHTNKIKQKLIVSPDHTSYPFYSMWDWFFLLTISFLFSYIFLAFASVLIKDLEQKGLCVAYGGKQGIPWQDTDRLRGTHHTGVFLSLGQHRCLFQVTLLRVHSPQSLVSELLGLGANTQNRGAPKSSHAIREDKIHLGRAPSYIHQEMATPS